MNDPIAIEFYKHGQATRGFLRECVVYGSGLAMIAAIVAALTLAVAWTAFLAGLYTLEWQANQLIETRGQ